MTLEDIAQVSTIERLCFSMPWPTSAYRRELKTPDTNRYIVVRYVPPADAALMGLPQPTEENLTRFAQPELGDTEKQAMIEIPQSRSLLSSLFPWLRASGNGTGNGTSNGQSAHHHFPVVGYAGLWLMLDEAHVTTIGVHPDHRGRGAGELLFLGLADIAAKMRAARITLEVRVSNTGAQALYRKYGLEVTGLRRRYYSDNGEDAIVMWTDPIDSESFQQAVRQHREKLNARLGPHE
jgi:ribosomal-protein-alanine N-acetyltransferase